MNQSQEVERLRYALMRIQRLDLADLRRAGEVEDIGYQAQEIANAALATPREEPAEGNNYVDSTSYGEAL